MAKVTEDDKAYADQLFTALGVKPSKEQRKAVAQLLAGIHERAVSCAIVRAEREFELEARKQMRIQDYASEESK